MAQVRRQWPATRDDMAGVLAEIEVLARGLGPTPPAPPRRRRSRLIRLVTLLVGLGLIGAGVVVIARPLFDVWQRGRADDSALQAWNSGGSREITGAAPDTADAHHTCNASTAPADDYALVTFPTLGGDTYQGVAGDGTWDSLTTRSMVHYRGSAAPGAQGNAIIAFHREPHYQHIDQLAVGDVVTVEDRSCATYRYRISARWQGAPDQVTQLVTTSGHDLTLITCTPWWQDYDRLVWRATLLPSTSGA